MKQETGRAADERRQKSECDRSINYVGLEVIPISSVMDV